MYTCVYGGQKKTSNPLELQYQAVLRHLTWDGYKEPKRSECFKIPSHLAGPRNNAFKSSLRTSVIYLCRIGPFLMGISIDFMKCK